METQRPERPSTAHPRGLLRQKLTRYRDRATAPRLVQRGREERNKMRTSSMTRRRDHTKQSYPYMPRPRIRKSMPTLPDKTSNSKELRYIFYNIPAHWNQRKSRSVNELMRRIRCDKVVFARPLPESKDRLVTMVHYRNVEQARSSFDAICGLVLSPTQGDYIQAVWEPDNRSNKRRRESSGASGRAPPRPFRPADKKRRTASYARAEDTECDVLIPEYDLGDTTGLFKRTFFSTPSSHTDPSVDSESDDESVRREDTSAKHHVYRENDVIDINNSITDPDFELIEIHRETDRHQDSMDSDDER